MHTAKVTISENKQFEDNRLTVKSNEQNFIGEYKFILKRNYLADVVGDVLVIEITDLNTDVTYAKVRAIFPNKV